MANDHNNCSFIGRLGKDPETRYMPSGDALTSFSIAVGSQWKDKSGEKQESTEWVNITVFGKLAEICGEYLKKGSQVFVSGRMKTDKYDDKDGITRYSTKIVAERMQMLGGKSDGGQRGGGGQQNEYDSNPPGRPGGQDSKPADADIDRDIPF